MSTCIKCNAELKPNAKFCHVCGEQTPQQHEHEPVAQQPPSQTYEQTTNLNQNVTEQRAGFSCNIQNSGFFQRVINIITKPKQEFNVIAGETTDAGKLFITYALPLMLIPAIAQLIGLGLIGKKFGVGFFSTTIIRSWEWGMSTAITSFLGTIISVFVVAFIIDALATYFGSEKNFNRSFQLVVYSFTPSWVAGIFYVFPFLGIITILAGLYGLVLLYIGIAPMKKTPTDKVTVYFIVALVVAIVISIIVGLIMAAVSEAIYSPVTTPSLRW